MSDYRAVTLLWPGLFGSSGAGEFGEDVVFNVSQPSTVWTLSHNRGKIPEGAHFIVNDSPAETNWENISISRSVAYFASPQSGVAILEFRRP